MVHHRFSHLTKWQALTGAIGRPDLVTDERFADPTKQSANSFSTQPHCYDEVFGLANRWPIGHEAFEQGPSHVWNRAGHRAEVVQRSAVGPRNDIVVPLEDAGGKADDHDQQPDPDTWDYQGTRPGAPPEIGEHGEQVLTQLGFSAGGNRFACRLSGAVPHSHEEIIALTSAKRSSTIPG